MLRLRFERSRRKLSQNHVGQAAGIPQNDLSAIERGRLLPTPGELERLAAVFGVAPSELMRDVVVGESR